MRSQDIITRSRDTLHLAKISGMCFQTVAEIPYAKLDVTDNILTPKLL